MNYTNININSNDRVFKYIVEYIDSESDVLYQPMYFENDMGVFLANDEYQNVEYNKNYWDFVDKEKLHSDALFPKVNKMANFRLYFPRFSVDTYEKNVHYALSINTWINSVPVHLCSIIIDKKYVYANSNGVVKFLNDEYYECVDIKTIDPFEIVYSDYWKLFREEFCNELLFFKDLQRNDSTANLCITITPIKKVNNTWIKMDNYDSSQSVLSIKNSHNYLSVLLNFDNEDILPKFNCQIRFNELYNGNLKEYLIETYNLFIDENYKMKFCFIIGDKTDPYKYAEKVFQCSAYEDEPCKTIEEFTLDDFSFESWDEYIEGMCARVFVIIQKNSEDILFINSNTVFITQEIFKYLIKEKIRKVDFTNIDMELKQYDVVNVIENKVVTVERPNEYRNNLIKPIFVKVQDTDAIRLHRTVTENIVINLDAYKNKVDAFILKIGDFNSYEIGRINSGIVFKVNGNNLPTNDGNYYILNSDGEMVTTGKYTIV